MKTLLITGIGGDIAQGVARVVRLIRSNWRILGVDIHRRHGGELFADAIETVPPVTAANYLVEMESLARRHRVDVCLPMSEAELGFIVSHGISSFGDAPFIGVSRHAVQIGLDKLATAHYLTESGVAAPWTVAAVAGIAPPSLPCIFKPRRSAGSKGVVVCHTTADAAWYASRGTHGVFQELLLPADREVTCAIYRARTGATSVLPMLRQLVGGLTGWAQVIDAPEAVEQCVALAHALDLHGPINAQLRITDGGPRIFEINPRLSSTVYMRHLLGFRDVQWMLDEYEGREVSFPRIRPGRIAVRTQDAVVLQGDGD